MNIDRHNYEEFFILYLDNELSDSDRRAVEEFAQSNSDLQEELNILLQSKFTPDMDVVLEDKTALIRTEEVNDINMANYEEWLLLYNDNELDAEHRRAVEKFITVNPALAQELSILRQATLEADTSIVFPDKELLYRRETKVRVISFRRLRVAAAAILLLGMSTSVYMLMEQKRERANGISNTNNSSLPTANSGTSNQLAVTGSNEIKTSEQVLTNSEDNIEKATAQTENMKKDLDVPLRRIRDNKKNDLLSVSMLTSTDKTENIRIDNNTTSQLNGVINSQPTMTTGALTELKENKPEVAVTPVDARPSDIQTPEMITDKDLAGVDQSGKKNKFRGFFRKVTRTFEKTTNIKATDDEDRLLVAGLAIKL